MLPVRGTSRRILEQNVIILALLALVMIFGVLAPNFFSVATLSAMLSQLPPITVVAIGMTLVLVVGSIDLSVGSVLGLSAAIAGIATVGLGFPLWLGGLMSIGAGAACGFLSGYISSYLLVPSFIVTLGMLEVCRGLAYLTTNSQTVYIGPEIQRVVAPIFSAGTSVAMLITLLVVVGGHLLHVKTVFGRYITAIGANAEAARMSGIPLRPYRTMVLMLSGTLAGLAGLFNAAYLGAADPNAGIGLELSAIAAAVIGGTSLMGGRGSVPGTFAGVMIIVVIQNGLAQIGVSDPTKRLITGSVIIAAVLVDQWRARSRR